MSDQAAFRPDMVLERVRSRLEAAGAAVELKQFDGLSDIERDVLIRRECGWGPQVCEEPSPPADLPPVSTGSPTDPEAFSTGKTQGCSPSDAQASQRTMAA